MHWLTMRKRADCTRKTNKKDKNTIVGNGPVTKELLEYFKGQLIQEINNILHEYDENDPNHPENTFSQATNDECKYCNYINLCNRKAWK